MKLLGELNDEFAEWLRRSLVCTTEEPRDHSTLASAIIDGLGQCCKVRTFTAIIDGRSNVPPKGVNHMVYGC